MLAELLGQLVAVVGLALVVARGLFAWFEREGQ